MSGPRLDVPDWVRVDAVDAEGMRVTAQARLPSGLRDGPVELRIRSEGGVLAVREVVVGSTLPACCPELHVVLGGDFCLGAESDGHFDAEQREAFWRRLEDFLLNQRYARRHRRWPAGRWLSHGPTAALSQLKAERLAAANGWREEYADALENRRGWLASALPRPNRRGGLVNGRTACPRGCRRRDGAPMLRRKCPKRADLETLVLIERARREAEARYVNTLRAAGVACCGRVDGCPLQS